MISTMNQTIGIIGAGQIGGITALLALEEKMGNVAMYDIVENVAEGKALDLNHLCFARDLPGKAYGYADMDKFLAHKPDVLIITAGVPRKPGMSRDDLLGINSKIVKSIAGELKKRNLEPFCILTTNPLDVMVMEFQEAGGFPAHKVIGMAGILDVSRFKFFLGEELGVASKDIRAMLMGGHGDTMVPIPSHTTVNGIPLSNYIKNGKMTEQRLREIEERTRKGGGEVVALLKTGSAFNAPAAACIEMAKSILFDMKSTLPCCVQLNGQYGYSNIYGGVPCVLGKNGVEEIIELELTEDEKKGFDHSMAAVKELREACAKLGQN